MFFLKLEENDLKLLLKLANEKGMNIEPFARLAFLKGLRILRKEDIGDEISLYPRQAQRRRKPLEEIHTYISEHWEQQTDAEMARVLECSSRAIAYFRSRLGLIKKRGRISVGTSHDSPAFRHLRMQWLEGLIRCHYESKTDPQIGQLMEPSVTGNVVRSLRLRLGLKRKQGYMRSLSVKSRVDPVEFERMITREGYTMSDYRRINHLRCTNENLRRVAEELGVKHSANDRAPEWALHRRARQIGKPEFANREWLAERLASAVSLTSLAAELGTNDATLYFFIRSFRLAHPQIRKHGVMVEELVCAGCGITFKRLKRWVNAARKKANGKELKFYCKVSCAKRPTRMGISREEVDQRDHFIREHWQTKSDREIGETLGLCAGTVVHRRLALGLRRKTGPPVDTPA